MRHALVALTAILLFALLAGSSGASAARYGGAATPPGAGVTATLITDPTGEAISRSHADDYPEDTIARGIVVGGVVVIGLFLLQLTGRARLRRAYR